jgi:lysophospholipase L1-like esterase
MLGTFIVGLGVAEGVYRVHLSSADGPADDPEWRRRYRHMNESIYRRSDDPELVYEPVASSSVEMEYGTAGFNAARMRDDREHEPLNGALPRVAMLGDSLVWSEFVSIGDSLPRRVEEALDGSAEVLGFGVTGYDTTQEARWYEVAVRPFRPDVVVLVWCMNDMQIASGPFERYATPEESREKDQQDTFFAREAPVRRETIDDVLSRRERDAPLRLLARALGLWERHRFEADYVDEYLIAERSPERRARTHAAIARLGEAIRADGSEAVLVISPVLEAWERYQWDALHAFVKREGTSAGFAVVDPLETWRSREDPFALRVHGDNLHYGVHGNEVFGRAIATAVRDAFARRSAR